MPTTSAHTRYKNKCGNIVPGVTTVIGLLNKPQLVIWANRLGLQGIDSTKYRDDKAAIGSLAHAMIMADLKGEKADTSDYSENQITQSETCYLQWLDWCKGKALKPVCIETPMVSEDYHFGGCPDYLGYVNGDMVLCDYKTGGIYRESYIQTCAYAQLLYENAYPPTDKIIILGIPRSSEEKFQEVTYTDFSPGWQVFKHLLAVYELLKDIK